MIQSDTYQRTSRCDDYDDLSKLTEDKFYESFLEAGPQVILQLMIYLQLGLEMNLSLFLAILTSMSTLVQTVVSYYSTALQKNPARRELTLVGQLAVIATKTPSVISRCVALSIFFASKELQVKNR